MSDTRREAEILQEITTQYRSLVSSFLDFSAKLNNYFELTAQQLQERRNEELQKQGTNQQQIPNASPLINPSTPASPNLECDDCNEPIDPNRPQPSPSTMAHTGFIHLPFTEESKSALMKFIPPRRGSGADSKDGRQCHTISCPNCSSKLEIKIEVKRV